MTTIIQAKMQGKCGKCGKTYSIGTRIAKDAEGRWAEADCLWPSHKGAKPTDANPPLTPQPRQTKEDSGSSTWSPADEAAIGLKVAARLKRAREMVDKQFPDAKGYSDYMAMVAEIAHQLFAEAASMSIQSAKERNMQQIAKR